MAPLDSTRLSALFARFGAKVLFLWRYFAPFFYVFVGYTLRSITWRESSRGLDEGPAEASGEAGPGELPRCQEEEHEDDDGDDDDEEEEEEEESDSEKYRVETTDEFYCSYDSTWETDESTPQPQRRRPTSSSYKFQTFVNAARDMQKYRHDYPIKPPHWRNLTSDEMPNLNFYCGLQPSQPDGVFIHTFLQDWFGRYDKLERVHTYIQWLFPLQEPGMNYSAHPLTKREIKAFLENDTAKKTLLESYILILDFYGIQLLNVETGEVGRWTNWAERFENLNMNTHNNLRITRILKCLGTLGYAHYQAPLVRFFLEETLVHGTLPSVRDSALNYFLFAVLDRKQRRKLVEFAFRNYGCDEFVCCPKKLQTLWSRSPRAKPKMAVPLY